MTLVRLKRTSALNLDQEAYLKRGTHFTNNFLMSYLERDDGEAKASFLEAAKLRKCLG